MFGYHELRRVWQQKKKQHVTTAPTNRASSSVVQGRWFWLALYLQHLVSLQSSRQRLTPLETILATNVIPSVQKPDHLTGQTHQLINIWLAKGGKNMMKVQILTFPGAAHRWTAFSVTKLRPVGGRRRVGPDDSMWETDKLLKKEILPFIVLLIYKVYLRFPTWILCVYILWKWLQKKALFYVPMVRVMKDSMCCPWPRNEIQSGRQDSQGWL